MPWPRHRSATLRPASPSLTIARICSSVNLLRFIGPPLNRRTSSLPVAIQEGAGHLNVHWFASLEDAQQKIDAFRWDYNENHPHRALKRLSPKEYARRAMQTAAESPWLWS